MKYILYMTTTSLVEISIGLANNNGACRASLLVLNTYPSGSFVLDAAGLTTPCKNLKKSIPNAMKMD